jgi:hypothetical protein
MFLLLLSFKKGQVVAATKQSGTGTEKIKLGREITVINSMEEISLIERVDKITWVGWAVNQMQGFE